MRSVASSSIQNQMNFPDSPQFSIDRANNQTTMTNVKPFNKKLASDSATIDVDDLLLQIMTRLPLNSIQRFKTVCKQWYSLITSPTLRKLWRKHNLKPPTAFILLLRVPRSIHFLPFSSDAPTTLPHLNTKLKIKQSCNGLLLYLTKTRYHVWNPTTNTCHTLPELGSGIVRPGRRIYSMNLAFDPNNFGPHFKVICCVSLENSNRVLHVHVYSSDTRAWKSIFNHGYTGGVNKDKGVYWNGSIHWMHELTYFNIESETFNVMPGPPFGSHWRDFYFFGESCDRLNYAKLCKTKKGVPRSVKVYELKRDYSDWILKYHVELDSLPYVVESVNSVVHGVEEDDSFLVLEIERHDHSRVSEIIRYNLVSRTSEVMTVPFTRGIVDRAFQYIESQYRV